MFHSLAKSLEDAFLVTPLSWLFVKFSFESPFNSILTLKNGRSNPPVYFNSFLLRGISSVLFFQHSAPEDVVMIIKDARNRDALLQELMKCGIVIYDITQDQGQVEEARWALKC